MNPKLTRVLTALAFLLTTFFTAQATQYRTVQSGNYSSTATWNNGVVPPTVLGADDTVWFYGPNALSIVMDRDIVMSSSTCAVYIFNNITITESGKHFIAVQNGAFIQDGGSFITIDSFYLSGNAAAPTNTSGNNTFNKLTLSAATYKRSLGSRLNVNDLLHLKDGVCSSLYQIVMAPFCTIYFSDGGGLSGSNAVYLANPYNLKYANVNTAPIGNKFEELSGSGTTLHGIEIDGNVILHPPTQILK